MDSVAEILQLLSPKLGESDGEAVPLEGGITNRNYRATLGGREYVIRLPGKDTDLLGIDRGAERQANQTAAGMGIAPSVAAYLDDPPCIVTEFIEGRGLEPEDLRRPETLASVARSLNKVHDCRAGLPTDFDSFRVVEEYARVGRERGAEVPAAFDEMHEHAAAIESALTGPEHEPVCCHNDLLAANFLDDGERIWIFDWEYAGMGDRYFDLGNFAVNNGFDEDSERALLEAYFGEPPTAPRVASLRLMRFMSDFREAMWGVVQSAVSELDFDFTGYAEKHFGRLKETAADERFPVWLDEAG